MNMACAPCDCGSFFLNIGLVDVVRVKEPIETDYPADLYTIIPGTEAQTLPTKGKVLAEDIVVQAIPYAEVSNPTGGLTVTIGIPQSA